MGPEVRFAAWRVDPRLRPIDRCVLPGCIAQRRSCGFFQRQLSGRVLPGIYRRIKDVGAIERGDDASARGVATSSIASRRCVRFSGRRGSGLRDRGAAECCGSNGGSNGAAVVRRIRIGSARCHGRCVANDRSDWREWHNGREDLKQRRPAHSDALRSNCDRSPLLPAGGAKS